MAPVMTKNSVSTHDFSISNGEKLSLQTYSEGRKINMSHKSLEVIGIILADDRSIGKSVGSCDSRSVVLGTVCIDNMNMSVDELRRTMCAELPCLPASFNFLSREGWPIYKPQEHKVKASHVVSDNKCISIKRDFEQSRVGIVTAGGETMGFVFTDLNVNIKQLREAIEQQLKISQQLKLEYRFIERNGWPIMVCQEPALSLLDIMLGQIVCIQNFSAPTVDHPRPVSIVSANATNAAIENQQQPPPPIAQEPPPVEHEPVKRKKSLKFINRSDTSSSVKSRKESEKRQKLKESGKPILISYVRAEAAQYALDLKQELVTMGFSVYLDVHEIKTGSDWQDALNFAVTHCFLFVPLITPMYGKTQWTNREVKLADVLGKKIIPVNFMDQWPPACLAIQFASTQYIPWKLQDSEHVKSEQGQSKDDPRNWDPICLKNVATKIAECYRDNYAKIPRRNFSNKEIVPAQSRPLLSAREDYYVLSRDEYIEDSKRIVISCHPRQKYLAQDLKSMFEKAGHEVWCSIDMLGEKLNNFSIEADPTSPRNLPTIQEGDVFFSQNEEYLSTFGEKKSFSINRDHEAYGKRPLSRLVSQFSDISYHSTLSKEKRDYLQTFQNKVDEAAVVIVLVSEAFIKSTFSHQQVFYIEHRKHIVLVRCDLSPVPKWLKLLVGNDMIMKVNNPQFECVLKARVKRALNPSTSETPKDATLEAKINYLVNFLKRNLPFQDICVYIAGSSKLQSERSEDICRALGAELAKMERLTLVTGGYYGAADLTAKTFSECWNNNITKEESAVVHILPMHESEDVSAKAKQNPDGSFEAMPYGKTLFLGDSVKERETVVARLLDTCIVIEGGPGVVHEIEEFIWNDHFVIPIMSTGGAAGGQYGVPVKIFECPPGVDRNDWNVLNENDASPEAVAKAVLNIIISLKKSIASPTSTLEKSKGVLKRKSRKKSKSRKFRPLDQDMQLLSISSTPDSTKVSSMREVFEIRESSEVSQSSSDEPRLIIRKKNNWFRRLINAFKHRN